MENDIEDIVELSRLNQSLENITEFVVGRLKKEIELRLKIIRQLAVADIDDKLSWDNKLIKMLKTCNDDMKTTISDYLNIDAEIKMARMKKEQIEEAIKSKKKVIDIRPR